MSVNVAAMVSDVVESAFLKDHATAARGLGWTAIGRRADTKIVQSVISLDEANCRIMREHPYADDLRPLAPPESLCNQGSSAELRMGKWATAASLIARRA
jgi:hypothetical protein